MLELKGIHLAFGGDTILEDVEAFVGPRERIGLIGANGAGKTTLFRLLTSKLKADKGQIDWQRNKEIGILEQELEFPEDMALLDFVKTAKEDINNLDEAIARVELQLDSIDSEDWEGQTQLADDLYQLQEKKRLHGAGKLEAEAEKIAEGLGYIPSDFNKPLQTFSGGWKMRAELARLLLQKPDLLLLDEPTNHLDIYSIIWLENWLSNYEGSVIFISHDAHFLQQVACRIWQLEHRKMIDYSGRYENYLIHREDTDAKRMSAFLNQEKKLKELQRTVERFRAKASKAKMAQSLEKMIQREVRIEIDNPDLRAMNIRWPEFHKGGKETMGVKNVSHSYNGIDNVIDKVDILIERQEKIGFVGKNGTGKSTMAKIMVGALQATSGQVNLGYKIEPYYFDQYAADNLNRKLSILETVEFAGSGLTTGELRSLLGCFMFSGEDVHKKTKVLSGGEKNRLALALMILSKSNFLVLDEPTNHLDISSRLVLKNALREYPGTLIVVSHDRTFMSGLTDRTYFFDHGRITNYLGDINYVLEKEAAQDMRVLELDEKPTTSEETSDGMAPAEQSTKKKTKKKKSTGEYEQRKRLKTVEQKIVRLEEQKSTIETEMAFPDFYQLEDREETIEKYNNIKEELTILNAEWEKLAEQMV